METIAFIICYDKERYLEECIYYIRKLHVPKGFRIDIVSVRDVSGNEELLQEAVKGNGAQFKVCMDQRIYIVNDYFLYEMIDVFRQERLAGAVGILGGGTLEEISWGRLLLWDENGIEELNAQPGAMEPEEKEGDIRPWAADLEAERKDFRQKAAKADVALVDFLGNMLIVTRCDTVDCVEIKERGYRLAVPYQKSSWCLYDCRENGADGAEAEYCFMLMRVEMCHDLACAGKVKRMLTKGRLSYKEHRNNVGQQSFAKVITGYFWEDFLLGKKPDRYLAPDGAVCINTGDDNGVGKDKMHVVMAFNHPYVVYAAVMLQSLYENNTLCEVHVHVLQCELSEMDKSLLQGQAQEFGNEVLFYDCRKEWLPEGCLVTQEWPLEAYFRLFMMDVLPEDVDRILYLDVDVIVNRPLYEFYFMDMQGYGLVACRDFSLVLKEGFGDKRKELFAAQEAEGDFVYFNSGVMLADIGRLRGEVCSTDYLKMAEELEGRLLAPDQDILNMAHWRHVGLVDEYRYDLFQGCLKELSPEEVKQQVSIIHYAGPKPWRVADVNLHAHRIWWEYAGRVGFLQ